MVACPLGAGRRVVRGDRRLGGPGRDDRARGRRPLTRRSGHRCLQLGLGDAGLWLPGSLVDTARDRRVGSANSDTDRTNSESSIKAWIAADYLRVAQAEGRAVTGSERADIAAMVRSSDNAAAQRLYEGIG